MRLRDSLSNPSRPLARLFKVVEDGGGWAPPQVEPVMPDPAVATEVRECRMLSADEVTELVEAYRRGATELSLARKYGVHRHTVDRHLERAGVAKRPVVKMTPTRVEQAKELYEQGLSTNQIGKKFGISGSTVWKALKRAGVQMRAPVAR
ncbi:helix-turn-helix domain-containing protein [Streptomyces sp. AMCC400023]|uniref:helix-turn-helix domain-containing protein n=1 Tax=Streptomyces sp. AMCC400023 TaxID=2056258 RepID=UPI001F02C036|nr:helix-turn-helix domain-containing protein [Streptomyces sp. AMCC400023]